MMRNLGLPASELWSILLDRPMLVHLYEDNQAVLQIINTGKNMTMRHFERTHRVPVAWLHELYHVNKDEFFEIHFAKSEEMIADLFTKAFSDRNKFEYLRTLTGLATCLEDIKSGVGLLQAKRNVETLVGMAKCSSGP